MKTKEQIEALRVALLIARHEAEKLADVEDGGTCNMDTPYLFLVNWENAEIEEAFNLTGLRPYIRSTRQDIVHVIVFDACTGQGFRRTEMARAFRNSMRESGYNAYVEYRMD